MRHLMMKSPAILLISLSLQVSNWGHDSYEDARACVELMLWKTRKDLASRKSTENSLSNS